MLTFCRALVEASPLGDRHAQDYCDRLPAGHAGAHDPWAGSGRVDQEWRLAALRELSTAELQRELVARFTDPSGPPDLLEEQLGFCPPPGRVEVRLRLDPRTGERLGRLVRCPHGEWDSVPAARAAHRALETSDAAG